jgi:hypothetical protein
MKDLEPLPYRYKHIFGKVVQPGKKVVETSKLVSSAFDDIIYSVFVKPYVKVYSKLKTKRK